MIFGNKKIMILELVHSKSVPSIMKRMFKALLLLLALMLINFPIAVRAAAVQDSCCRHTANMARQIQLSMPDPTRLIPSDIEITIQLMDGQQELLKPLSVSSVLEADDQIHIQFFLEALHQNWKNNSCQSDMSVDRSFRLSNLPFTGDAASADLEIQDQFQKEFM